MSGIETDDSAADNAPASSEASRRLIRALERIPETSFALIALSGGLDSSALLRLAVPLLKQRGVVLRVVHVNHGLSAYATNWEQFCHSLCQQFDLDCVIERVNISSGREGWEAAARRERYRVFQKHMDVGGILLQAHHLDDQIETVFMRLSRHRHLMTLAGIPKQRDLSGGGRIFRPWLEVARRDIRQVAEEQGWQWVEDESNQDIHFERNRVRHQDLPRIRSRYCQLDDDLLGLSRKVSRLKAGKRALLDLAIKSCGADKTLMPLTYLRRLSRVAQYELLRHWIDRTGIRQPSEKIMERLWEEVLDAGRDRMPMIQWGRHQLRRYAGSLYLVDADSLAEALPKDQVITPGQQGQTVHFGRFVIRVEPVKAGALENSAGAEEGMIALPDTGEALILRPRRRVNSSALKGASGSVSLKKLFQQLRVPPWQRDSWPLLMCGDELVWAGGDVLGTRFRACHGEANQRRLYRFLLIRPEQKPDNVDKPLQERD